jgi:CelD/BcsL family acetyltransferase involved in cellulose biosynthesis
MKEEGIQTYLTVQPNWDQYIKTLSGKQRTNARRAFRDLEARKVNVVSRVVDAENLPESFDEFVQMHQTYWRMLLKPGHFKAWPRAREFHREQAEVNAESDRLRLLKITFDGKCVAYEYLYKTGETYFWFINGRSGDLYKSGFDFKWIALRAKLELAATEGVTTIDSMRGEYDYKVLMGGEQLPVRSVIVVSARGLTALKVKCFRALAWVIDVTYAKIWRMRLAPRIHYRVGSFCKMWIKSHVLSA